MSLQYMPRILDSVLEDYLDTFGAVHIKGPKWCGKTTTASQKAKSIIKLQDPNLSEEYIKRADISFSLLLEGKTPRLIDEWQTIPKIWDAVRNEVDSRQEKGIFILTGSVVPSKDATLHSGIGRIATLIMRPMSLYESQESSGTISLTSLFNENSNIDGYKSFLSIPELAYVICRGGWPSSMNMKEKSALLIVRDYIDSLCQSDISRLDGVTRNPIKIRSFLQSYARNISTLASNTTIIKDLQTNNTQISEATYYDYSDALTRLFIIEDIPSWNPSVRSKTAIRSKNKRGFIDPSLAIATLGLTPSTLLEDMNTFGFMFESLVIRDLKIYSQEIGGTTSYYRDRYGLECDCVLALSDGRYALIEIKLGSRAIEEGASHLLKLKKLIIENKMTEPSLLIVITGGEIAYERKDGVKIIPIGCLKV